ncbi:D-glycero-alpha-D-manno-heptose-1,7-bisphosphate 7-phosphatase [Paenarthrobacter nitroguajacolicus]|uniref:D-glycero-alpha-D-manno-heptose-1,7-bisphosphate 7-phosphatase n=1 Tax=Paenarthrobacter nitroguajacolicus TaxID=211146 RepID=UPI00248C87C0|nr:HAD-IIIA family hydrolase [Paenarthrobacter nitroguajacolicus]MDI2035114.1 Phosphoglycolate phosphatase [Paenarthrobacter nitroguajacolicus]
MGGTGTLKAVLFDRDGTLVVDVPYNGDPQLVRPMDGARAALLKIRGSGLATGVVSNQSGVARGLLTMDQVESVNRQVETVLGPFDVWEICPHGPEDGCECRKPAPGMILAACQTLGIMPNEAAFIGDIGADVQAATAAGSRSVLVPTPVTRQEEIDAAEVVALDLGHAVELLLGGRFAPAESAESAESAKRPAGRAAGQDPSA